jgi:hypothetical protein
MRGGIGHHIAARGGLDKTPETPLDWTNLDQSMHALRFTTQQIRGISGSITLSVTVPYGGMYYRLDASSSSFASSVDPSASGSGWTQFTSSPQTISVSNNQWLSFGVPYEQTDCDGYTTVEVENVVSGGNVLLDAFEYHYFFFDCGSLPP